MAATYERTYKVNSTSIINQLNVRVSYHKDGYANGPRGYYLHVQPLEVTDMGGGLQRVQYVPYKGRYKLLAEVKRANKTKFNEAIAKIDELMDEHLDTILAENELTLVSTNYTERIR